jgi:hypothetical protein
MSINFPRKSDNYQSSANLENITVDCCGIPRDVFLPCGYQQADHVSRVALDSTQHKTILGLNLIFVLSRHDLDRIQIGPHHASLGRTNSMYVHHTFSLTHQSPSPSH